jgi:hypothetical protein
MESEIGGTGSHTMVNSVWQRQWSCRKAVCVMNDDDDDYDNDAHAEHEIYTVCSLILLASSVSVHIGCLLECHVILLSR